MTTDNFPKVGDEHQVVNVSGADWPGAQMLARDSSKITAPPPGRALSHRQPRLIDADSGQQLGLETEQAAAYAARHLSIEETVDRADAGQREQEYLDHVFGLNLRGRDRA